MDNIQDSRFVHLCEAVMGSWPREGAAQRLPGPSPGSDPSPSPGLDIPAARNNHKGDVRAQGGVREVYGGISWRKGAARDWAVRQFDNPPLSPSPGPTGASLANWLSNYCSSFLSQYYLALQYQKAEMDAFTLSLWWQ